MIDLDEINSLPEGCGDEVLRSYFDSLIKEESNADVETQFEILNELSDRQWHTYQRIDSALVPKLETWIRKHVDIQSLPQIEMIGSIAANLGLKNTFEFLKSLLETNVSDEVREEIAALIEEIGDDIEAPYSGMNRQ